MLRVARREPSAILLVTQLAGLILYPLLGDNFAGRAVLSLFGVAVLILATRTVRRSPAVTWVAWLLGGPATILLLVQIVTDDRALLPYSSALEAVLYFYAAGALIAYMLHDHRVTRDELFAVGATFTLVVWGFAYVYTVCQIVQPGSFTGGAPAGDPQRWVELLFLSMTTLTSVGLSDIVPLKPFARSLVMIEQMAGIAYVAMLVSRVVGLTVLSGRERP